MYYSSFGMLAVVIHLIINLRDMKKPESGADYVVSSRYRMFLISSLIYYIADILWGMLYEARLGIITYIDTMMFFATMGLTVYTWMRYIVAFLDQKSDFCVLLKYAGAGLFAIQIIALIVNLFYPIVFRFDEAGEYYPGNVRYVMLSLQVVLFAATAIYPLLQSFRHEGSDRLHYRAVGLSGAFMTAFIVLQTMYPFLPFYAVGCLVATCIIHTFVVMDEKEEFDRQLGSVKKMAYKDPLTNVRNSTAYLESKRLLDQLIKAEELKDFAVAVFDVNNLKSVNDLLGHEEGDKYIQNASRLICRTFTHSPVFRIGGDEFVAFLEGEDFENNESLFESFNRKIDSNMKNFGVVVSAGIEVYDPKVEHSYDELFEKADRKMYTRKMELKKGEFN